MLKASMQLFYVMWRFFTLKHIFFWENHPVKYSSRFPKLGQRTPLRGLECTDNPDFICSLET